MLAAVVQRRGVVPTPVEDWPEPDLGEGRALVEVAAAALNPLDLAIAGGAVPGAPEGPYVPGVEAVGRVLSGDRLRQGARVRVAGVPAHGGGCLAERIAVDEHDVVEVPDGLGDACAAGLGVAGMAAWFALTEKARLGPGEHVAVLGATGAVGTLAVQLAKLLGAGTVVAAGRHAPTLARLVELGADRTVMLAPNAAATTIAAALRDAAGGPLDVVVDPLWGEPGLGGLRALGPGGRHVNIGHAAGPEVTLRAVDVRGAGRTVLGHASALVCAADVRAAYRTLAEHAAAGRLTVPCEVTDVRDIAAAWDRQGASPHTKLAVAFDAAGFDDRGRRT